MIDFARPAPIPVKKNAVKIGRPGYKVTKIRDPATRQSGLLFQISYPEIGEGIKPRHRFMSAYEQKIEVPNRAHQYLIFAAEPYENVAFKVQSMDIDQEQLWTYWDPGKDGAGGLVEKWALTGKPPSSFHRCQGLLFAISFPNDRWRISASCHGVPGHDGASTRHALSSPLNAHLSLFCSDTQFLLAR